MDKFYYIDLTIGADGVKSYQIFPHKGEPVSAIDTIEVFNNLSLPAAYLQIHLALKEYERFFGI